MKRRYVRNRGKAVSELNHAVTRAFQAHRDDHGVKVTSNLHAYDSRTQFLNSGLKRGITKEQGETMNKRSVDSKVFLNTKGQPIKFESLQHHLKGMTDQGAVFEVKYNGAVEIFNINRKFTASAYKLISYHAVITMTVIPEKWVSRLK